MDNLTTSRTIQLLQLYILNKVSAVCEKHNLKYYLYGGTLLGAVRHKGFIPWDDDIDIIMQRNDYDKLLEIAQSELGPDFFVQHYTTDKNYTRYIIKIRLNGTKHVESFFDGIMINQGIYIDIFPLDRVPKQKSIYLCLRKEMLEMLSRILSTKKGLVVSDSIIKKFVKKLIKPIMYIFPDRFIHGLYESMFTLTSDSDGAYLSSFASSYDIKRETYLSTVFDEGVLCDFEGFKHPLPSDSHSILTQVFGDYMKLPPKDQQKGHDIIDVDFGKYAEWIKKKKISELY